MAENHHTDSKPPYSWTYRLTAPALLLLVTIGFYWKLTLTAQYTWFDHPDMAYLEIPRLEFQAREIHQHRFPLWDPHLWGGQPLIGQTQPGPLYPLNLLLYQLPLRGGYLKFGYLNWYWALIHFLAALFAYLLARDLGLGKEAAWMSAFAFGYGGFVGTVAWLDVVNGAIWTPLIILFVLRAERGWSRMPSAALGGLFLGVAWLSGHHEAPILVSLLCAVTWLYFCRRKRELLPAAGLFFLVCGLIAAVQVIPTYEFARHSVRWVGLDHSISWKERIPYTVMTIYSLPAAAILGLALPVPGRIADSSPFLGVVAVGLGFLGMAARWKHKVVKLATVMACGGMIYSLGALTPVQGILYSILPVVDKARIPARGILIVNFALALLAAFGMDALVEENRSRAVRYFRNALLAVGSLLLAVTVSLVLGEKEVNDRIYLAMAACLCGGALVTAWRNSTVSRHALFAGLAVLCLVELTNAGPAVYSNKFSKNANKFLNGLTQYDDVAAYLRSVKEGPIRVMVDDQVIGSNFGDWHGIDMMYGYVAGVSTNIQLQELNTQRAQDLFAVTHFIGAQADRPNQEEVFKGEAGAKVFRRPRALPRARAVHDARLARDVVWLRALIQDEAVDLRKTALFLSEAPKLEACEGEDEVRLVRHTSDRIDMEVRLPCRGLVVLAETMFPGWEAWVDGKPARIWEAYGTMRSVVVEGGSHRVSMRYRPRSVYAGAGLSFLGVLVTMGVCVAGWRRRPFKAEE
ncbi:MAG: YfhO family protein [Bryobacterales bacterium]|nr:YfhO family protein [Bryobacterales bacterium]